MYAFIFLFLSIHLIFLVREYHKTFMFTYHTSYNENILLLLRFFKVFLDTYISTYV